MASSTPSTSEPLASAEPVSQWKHDVFLSFRGEDTRKGVVYSLYEELQKRGVQTFMDDQGLQQGMSISPSLLTAIKESKCAIVVLSPNYASSTWCLDELLNILQCSEAKKTKVLPVFYNVDPSDVRNQRGSFAEAFAKHEEKFRHDNDNVEKQKKWRVALTKVANISGFDSNKYRSDKELVQCIVEVVCSDVRPITIMSNGGFEAFEATRRAMVELMKALENDQVTTIGVYGMGGVGKTTMVKHLSAQAQEMGLFDHVIMAVVSQTPYTRNIQGTLADLLGLKLEEETEIGRAGRLKKEILRRSKILIILDDIWNRLELSSIGIPSYDELQICNSKVVLTTRRLNVCHTMESQVNIHLNILSEEDAWNLFSKKARKSFQKSTEFYEVARKVARECAGLPIALIVVARALGDKDFEEWKEAARRLEISQAAHLDEERDVINCIKLSYDYLHSNDAKSCFLLCCLFPEDYDIQIEDLMKYGFGTGSFRDVNSTLQNARVRANLVIKYLKASCLLLDGTKEGCVKMHDVIRDTAISIAQSVDGPAYLVRTHCDFKDWSMDVHKDYSAISLIGSYIDKLPNKLVCPKVQILLLRNADIREIPKNFFQCLNDLRVLDLRNNSISSLPRSFNLLTRLQALHLDYCGYNIDISILGKVKKLEILSIKGCFFQIFPKEIGNLTNLKMLDLTGTGLETVPSRVFSRLSRLEELYMKSSFADWGSKVVGGLLCLICKNAEFDELTRLSHLNTLEVSVLGVECLPEKVEFNPNWVNFYICIKKSGFKEFPHRSSRALTIDTTMKELPDWFINVVTGNTEDLWYRHCYGLTNLLEEHDRGKLHGLKYLFIDSSNAKVFLNSRIWSRVSNGPVFGNLEELRIESSLLEELYVGESPPGSLHNLQILNVHSCCNLMKPLLPSKLLHKLESLEDLACSMLDIMEYVFGFEGHEAHHVVLKKLRMISLRCMHSLKNIWSGSAPPGIFQSLKFFYLINCPGLKYIFTSDVARCLLQLEDLWVQDCRRLDRIVEASEETESSKIIFPKLKNLVLKDLTKLMRFFSTSSRKIGIEIQCPLLEYLHVDRCPRFPNSSYGFNRLRFRISSSDFNRLTGRTINDRQYWILSRKIINGSELSHFPLNNRKVEPLEDTIFRRVYDRSLYKRITILEAFIADYLESTKDQRVVGDVSSVSGDTKDKAPTAEGLEDTIFRRVTQRMLNEGITMKEAFVAEYVESRKDQRASGSGDTKDKAPTALAAKETSQTTDATTPNSGSLFGKGDDNDEEEEEEYDDEYEYEEEEEEEEDEEETSEDNEEELSQE